MSAEEFNDRVAEVAKERLALSHDFMSNTKSEKNQFRLPPYLEDFPFSISMDELKQQYAKHGSAVKFNCDTNFLTREVLPTRHKSNKVERPNLQFSYPAES